MMCDNTFLSERPALTPWIAALWVEPEFRCQGIAWRLINAARAQAAKLGYKICYLCAIDDVSPCYATRGFTLIERGVGDQNIFSIPSKN